jgi:hypothetical protein
LLETWFKEEDSLPLPNYIPYNFYVKNLHKNAKRGCGGITVYIKDTIKDCCRIMKGSENIVWLELIPTEGKALAIGLVYIPPQGSTQLPLETDLYTRLEAELAEFSNDYETLLLGDFNAHTNTANDYDIPAEGMDIPPEVLGLNQFTNISVPDIAHKPRNSCDTRPVNDYGRQLLDLCISSNHLILNGRMDGDTAGHFTRMENDSSGVLDYAICSISYLSNIKDFQVSKLTPESDHCGIRVTLKSKLVRVKSDSVGMNATPCVRYFVKGDHIQDLRTNLASRIQESVREVYMNMCDGKSSNIIVDKFHQIILNSVDDTCFKKITSKPVKNTIEKKPWVDVQCQTLRKTIASCHNVSQITDLCSQYNRVKKKKKYEYKKSQIAEINKMCTENKIDFWRRFKDITKCRYKVILDPGDVYKKITPLSTPPNEMYFNRDFEQEANQYMKQYCQGLLPLNDNVMCEILNAPISTAEVNHAISKLKKGKSPGLDGLPAEVMINTKDILLPHLTYIYNYVLDNGISPDQWAGGLRVAIPKDNGTDIRPITITPVLGKIVETILDNRMIFIEEAFATGDVFNGGFKKNSSTCDNMFILRGCIEMQLCKGKSLFIAYVDFKKAFNFVNRNLLFMKLLKSGLHGKAIKLLYNMYCKTKACVKINGILYDWIFDKIGMNQGGPNSPLLFRKFLSDLSLFLKANCGIVISDDMILLHLLWADDMLLLADSPENLQIQLDGLFTFCKTYHMIVNETKTKIMVYGKESNHKFIYNGKILAIVNNYKYLGVMYKATTRCSSNIFTDSYTYTSNQARKAMFKILKDTKDIGMLPPNVAFYLFDSLVMPILEYGS